MNVDLRKKIKHMLDKKKEEGRVEAAREYTRTLSSLYKEHEKQIDLLSQTQAKEIKLLEKDYNMKASILDRKIQKLDEVIREWEENVSQVKEMSARSQEVIARVKQVMYQDRRTFANLLDDEKTIETLQNSFNGMLQKQMNKPTALDLN